MSVLVIAEVDEKGIKSATRNTVAAARKIGGEIDVLVQGGAVQSAAAQAAALEGVTRVLTAEGQELSHGLPENLATTVAALQRARSYSHIFFAASSAGKAAMPRLAALLDVPCVSEIVAVVSEKVFRRYIYAGGIEATVEVAASPVVASVRATAFEPVAESSVAAPVEPVAAEAAPRSFAFESIESVKSDRPDLLTAKRVVCAGRGVIDEAGFAAVQTLADKIGAAVGSTRALVDASVAPSETQVGQTGKIIAPELYIAFGVSGAIQHTAGMKDSKVIVVVNNDPEAPFFEMCDYYLETDAQAVLSELAQKL